MLRKIPFASISLMFLAALVGACSGDVAGPTAPDDSKSGAVSRANVAIEVSGLPIGIAADVFLRGPSNFSRRLTGSDTLRNVPVGGYTLEVGSVSTADGNWTPTQPTVAFEVGPRSGLATVRTTYSLTLRRSLLIVDVAGLPAQVGASLTLRAPGGNTQSLTTSDTVETTTTGDWTLSAASVAAGGHTYTGSPLSQTRTVRSRDITRFSVGYRLGTGALAVVVSGLPAGATPAITISNNSGFSRTVGSTTTITNLAPGSYTVSASPITVNGVSYAVNPASRTIAIDTGLVATPAQVSYAAVSAPTGSLSLSVAGLPTGEPASVLVTGPNGFSRTLTASATLSDLVAGAYVVSPARVRTALGTYDASPASVVLTVPSGGSVAGTVTYSPRPSVVEVTFNGLPSGALPSATLTNPTAQAVSLTASGWHSGVAGRWTLAAAAVRSGGFTYAAAPASYDQSVLFGDTLRFPVSYAVSTGAIAVTVSGLPSGNPASVVVSGPAGFTRTVSATETLTDLAPGTYTVAAAPVTIAGTEYKPTPTSRTITVTASLVAQSAVVNYASQAGQLIVALSGLPTGAAGDVLVTGPNAFSQAVTATDTLVGIGAGTYTLTPRNVRTAQGTFGGTAVSASVTAGTTSSSTVTYSGLPSVVIVSAVGVPVGSTAALTLTSPTGTNTSLTGSSTVSPAATGRWRLAAASVQNGGHTYTPSPASYDQMVLAGDTLRFPVNYALSTGAIAVSVAGLPSGAAGNVTVTGPAGFTRTVTGTQTLTDLAPGSYTITATNVSSGGITYVPSPLTRTVTVAASLVAQPAAVSYTSQAGQLIVSLGGLPTGSAGDVLVTGPNGFSQVVTVTDTLAGIGAGSYTLTPRNVRTAQGTFSGTAAPASASVTAGNTTSSSVTYSALPSVVIVSASGVPSGSTAALTLTSPAGINTSLTSGSTVSPAAAGRWRLAAASVQNGGHTYTPSPASYDQTVLAGDTLRLPVTYALSTGAIAVSIAGLPSGVNGNVTVTGPSNFSRAVTSTQTITNLTPGSYTITAANVTSSGISWFPSPLTRTVTVAASLVAQAAPVAYTGQFGRLTTGATGLPAGATPSFTITGPITRSIVGTVTTDSLPAGSYTVTPAPVTVNSSTYVPSPSSSTVAIATGSTAAASFGYTLQGGGGGTNFSIEGAYMTQAVQRMDGTVPLVAGREALLRVFVRASGANTATPTVRVRLLTGGVEYRSVDITAPGSSVPTTISEGTLNASWNTVLQASDMRAGMQLSVSFVSAPSGDPDPSDDTWPRSGLSAPDVRTVPGATIRFVPIRNAADNTTGNVTSGNMASIAALARRQHPLNTVTLSLRATFTSSAAGSFQSNDGNGAWNNTLFDLEGLRTMEGGGSTHYAGILATNYSSGLAGLAYMGGRSSLTWDKAGSVASVFSHELGHNFGRSHAPGCGTSGADASYPLASGLTDAFGWNGSSLLNPASTYDHMGYCNPSWTSAYGWTRIMNRRQQFGSLVSMGNAAMMESPTAEESLVIWGGVSGAQVQLNPAVTVQAPAQLPEGNGTHRLELLDANGQVLAGYGFTPQPLDHSGDAAGFSFAIPRRLLAGEPAEIRLRRGPIVLARQNSTVGARAVSAQDSAGAQSARLVRPQLRSVGGRTRVEWDDRAFPLAVVRDAQSGTILGFLRRSGEVVETRNGVVDVDLSNGVRSVRMKSLR